MTKIGMLESLLYTLNDVASRDFMGVDVEHVEIDEDGHLRHIGWERVKLDAKAFGAEDDEA